MFKGKGFTLVEIMISLGILAIVLVLSAPSFSQFIVKTSVDNEISTLLRLVLLTRNTAIHQQENATLCPLNNNNTCSGEWHNELSVFTDSNNNKILESQFNERILAVKAEVAENYKLQYGTTRLGLTYSPSGKLAGWGQNATFTVCPKGFEKLSRGVIVAVSGRAYSSTFHNKHHVDINRSNNKISCN